jgi:hypothetical protein
MTKTGYFFLTCNDHLYYISIYDSQYAIVDVDKHTVVEFISSKALKPRDIEEFIVWMEKHDGYVFLGESLKEKLGAIISTVYSYEPRGRKREVKASEEARG